MAATIASEKPPEMAPAHDNEDDTPPQPPPKDYPAASTPPKSNLTCSCEVPESKATVSQAWPSKPTLEECGDLPVFDVEGNAHPFRSLYADPSQRHVIIFIRHFFCGVCQEYVRTLSTTIPPSTLTSSPVPVNLILISCGDPSRIPDYIKTTGCPFPIYTDPTRSLYSAFAFGRTWDLGPQKPEYIQVTLATTIVSGIYQVLKSGTGAWKGGDFMQIGGEMIFHQGQLEFFHRMENTRDHTEMDELRRLIGVKDLDKPPVRRRWHSPVKALKRRMSPAGKAGREQSPKGSSKTESSRRSSVWKEEVEEEKA